MEFIKTILNTKSKVSVRAQSSTSADLPTFSEEPSTSGIKMDIKRKNMAQFFMKKACNEVIGLNSTD